MPPARAGEPVTLRYMDEVSSAPPGFDTGLVAVVKKDCPTCRLVEPVLEEVRRHRPLLVLTQDEPEFPAGCGPVHDADLTLSHRLEVEIVPTLLSREEGATSAAAIGWNREQWQEVTGLDGLGADLPPSRPGCGALNVEPPHVERLAAEFASGGPRRVEIGDQEDDVEACFARGWSDGLPVVPPTPERVERMLAGTRRGRGEVLGLVAPDYGECTVGKVAVNAVMAGCRPEYLPVVLAAVEAALTEEFNWHGLAATTYFAGPVIVVNGPVTRALGMNSKMNVLGQGNRANSTIGRALQLVLRNVGGARPGEVDRATLGNPGKLGFCFAEREADSPWTSLAVERGVAEGASSVTLFAGEGPRGVVDQLSREPESLARSLASALLAVAHHKLVVGFDAMLVVGYEHGNVFRRAGWDKARLRRELDASLVRPGAELVRGAGGILEGLPERMAGAEVPKFRPGGLLIVHAGGNAGLFSAVVGGWVSGPVGSQPVTWEVGR